MVYRSRHARVRAGRRFAVAGGKRVKLVALK